MNTDKGFAEKKTVKASNSDTVGLIFWLSNVIT